MRARSRLRGRISLIVAAGALLVAAGVALLLSNTATLRSSAEATHRADVYLLRALNVERLVVDTETGLRGEVITGRTLFLQPLYRAESEMPSALAALQQAASENRAYRGQAAGLATAVRRYLSVYVHQIQMLTGHELSAARSFVATLEGKHLVDAIRGRVARLERLLSASQAARQRAAHATANRSIADAIAVLVVLTLLTIVVGGYLGHLAVGREQALRRSEETSRVLQESVLPGNLPSLPGCELATRFIPGGGAVSGDFYDVLQLSEGEWALLIGDVCGKGAAAAAATAMARWTLRSSLGTGASPADALRFLNAVVLTRDEESRFITAACLKLRFATELVEVEVACAGHPAPILVPRDGPPVDVAASGDLLGVLPRIRLHVAELQLRPGDSLVAYTDGVTDQGPEVRRPPDEALHARAPGADADQLAQILVDLARQPAGPHPDDIAILAVRFLGHNDQIEPAPVASAIAVD